METIYGTYNGTPFKVTLSEHSDKKIRNELMSKFLDDSIEFVDEEIYTLNQGTTIETNILNKEFNTSITIEVIDSLGAIRGIKALLDV